SPYVALHFATQNTAKYDRDGVVWCVDYTRAHALLPEELRRVLAEEGANVLTTELLAKASPGLHDLERYDDAFVLFVEPPSFDARIVNQYALFSVISHPDARLDEWVDGHTDLAARVVIPAEIKWEVRDKLDQANITERVLFPGLDGISRGLARERDLVQPDGAVDVEPAQAREPHRRHLTGHDRGQRAQPLRHARNERQPRLRATKDGLDVRHRDDAGAALAQRHQQILHRGPRGPRRRDDDDRPPRADRCDRAVHQVGRRVRLDDEPRALADLQRDLERRAVVHPAADDGRTDRLRVLVERRRLGERELDLGAHPLRHQVELGLRGRPVARREEERDRTERVQVRLRRGDGLLGAGLEREHRIGLAREP